MLMMRMSVGRSDLPRALFQLLFTRSGLLNVVVVKTRLTMII